jgi:hypothetical protein
VTLSPYRYCRCPLARNVTPKAEPLCAAVGDHQKTNCSLVLQTRVTEVAGSHALYVSQTGRDRSGHRARVASRVRLRRHRAKAPSAGAGPRNIEQVARRFPDLQSTAKLGWPRPAHPRLTSEFIDRRVGLCWVALGATAALTFASSGSSRPRVLHAVSGCASLSQTGIRPPTWHMPRKRPARADTALAVAANSVGPGVVILSRSLPEYVVMLNAVALQPHVVTSGDSTPRQSPEL